MSEIAIVKKVDLLILGASSGAVAAALAGKEAGATVFLASPYYYLGDDICAYLRYFLRDDERATSRLATEVFCENPGPAQVKRVLEQALVQASVDMVFGSYPVAALRDENGEIAGAVIGNRCGRQAIAAKRVVDASERGNFARLAAVPFSEWQGGEIQVERRVVAPEPLHENAVSLDRFLEIPGEEEPHSLPLFAYRLTEDVAENSPSGWAAMQKRVESEVWQHNQALASERGLIVPPDPLLRGRHHVGEWTDPESFDLKALHCAHDRIALLGPCADTTRQVAAFISRPAHAMVLGARLGAEMAAECRASSAPGIADVTANAPAFDAQRIRVQSNGFRPLDSGLPTVECAREELPVLGRWDVVVVGGGTAGAPAAIAAARQGAKTLVLESLHALGGVGTLGQISIYYYGNRAGFTAEIDRGVAAMGPDGQYDAESGRWLPQWKQGWYHQALKADHVDLWFNVVAYGIAYADRKVQGILVATPYGSGLVEAHSVLDCTGAAEIAATAGAPVRTIGDEHIAVQGTGLSPVHVHQSYSNTDHNFIDDGDLTDITAAMVSAKKKFTGVFDISQIVNSRERQQIIGEYELQPLDFFADHHFPDSICYSSSNFDSHGFTVHPVFSVKPPDKERKWVYVPYRALLPRGIDNLLVTGLGVSAHRDVLPVIRMQADVQNQGYAAGYAAAVAAARSIDLRHVEIRAIQEHLIEIGNLPAEVLQHQDNFPLPASVIAETIEADSDGYKGLACIFAYPEQSIPLLKAKFDQAEDLDQRRYFAQLLAMLGDEYASQTLIDAIEESTWDEGWNYRGMGQFGMSSSPRDNMIVALGRSGDAKAVPTIVSCIKTLSPGCDLSHARAVALAGESLAEYDRQNLFAGEIHRLLSGERMSGFHQHDIDDVQAALTDNPCENEVRNRALRELILARALYRCGDYGGLGEEILQNYARDMRGHFARHASAVLTRQVDQLG